MRVVERLTARTGSTRNCTKRSIIGGDLNLPFVDWKGNAGGNSETRALINTRSLVWENGYSQVRLQQVVYILRLLRYNSDTVLAFSTTSFHLRWFRTCSVLFYNFHLFQVISDIVFPSGLGSSYWSTCKLFPFVYFPYNTSFSHSIYVYKPTQSLRFNITYYVPMFY
jgi:hypothetical protein